MEKNDKVFIRLVLLLLLIITIQVALFAKHTDGKVDGFDLGAATPVESMEWFQPILSIPQPAPAGT